MTQLVCDDTHEVNVVIDEAMRSKQRCQYDFTRRNRSTLEHGIRASKRNAWLADDLVEGPSFEYPLHQVAVNDFCRLLRLTTWRILWRSFALFSRNSWILNGLDCFLELREPKETVPVMFKIETVTGDLIELKAKIINEGRCCIAVIRHSFHQI